YNNETIFPNYNNIFNAYKTTDFNKVKVVIIGQDPYHNFGEANGLAFSVSKNIKIPPSLRNIYKELSNDLNLVSPNHGDLSNWAQEGVLLINTILTVEKNKPLSHQNKGWEIFTKAVINVLNKNRINIVYILWGNYAKTYKKYIDIKNNYIIESLHPSPLSAYRGFFGHQPFSKTNNYLISKNIKPINWRID
ncbi:MAG TPA: uracil-DNA glycosylase, partial [Acholeplasmataceae bacterium]|nr:uracil-DNA glycosylase [Acholeplasmataceae bacterium]